MNVRFFNSRTFLMIYKKANGEDKCSAEDLPIMLNSVGTVIFYLIRKERRTESMSISVY